MDTTALVGLPIEAAHTLLDHMDERGLVIPVAFWDWVENHQGWRLVLSSPQVDVKGSLYLLEPIQQILSEMSDQERDGLTLRDIAIPGFNTLRIKEMRRWYSSYLTYGAKGVVPPQNARAAYEQKEPFIYRLA